MKKIILIVFILSAFTGYGQNTFSGDNTVKNLTATDTVTAGVLKATVAAGVGTKAIRYNPSTKLFYYADTTVAISIIEDTYTPTLTNTTNVAASTAYTTYYQRIGDVVRVWGEVDIDATALLTVCEMGLTLPVTSAISTTRQLAGTGAFEDGTVIQILGDVSNGRAKFRFTPLSTSNNKYSFHFTYKFEAP